MNRETDARFALRFSTSGSRYEACTSRPADRRRNVLLPEGYTWATLGELSPDEIRDRDVLPSGFFPLPHPKQPEGGMATETLPSEP
jgi:hypothetical protein